MSEEVLIRVDRSSKKFCRSLKRSLWYGACDMLSELNPFVHGHAGRSDADQPENANSQLRRDEFWAVNNVSFELRRGECLGLIGRNGAGKTTLLKMLNGLVRPDQGLIEMHGRVGGLIALGAGFNPILSGRENIYVNGSVLGLTNTEIEKQLDEIIDFADIREFIDSPVQCYSSGMQVRLGFAVATALEPDILLLDEVLAVGDASFRSKCYRRISNMRKKAAVVFVSHSMDQISRICDRTLVMTRGTACSYGTPAEGVLQYELLNAENEGDGDQPFLSLSDPIRTFSAFPAYEKLNSGQPLSIRFSLTSTKIIDDFTIGIFIYNASGGVAADGRFPAQDHLLMLQCGTTEFTLELSSIPLKRGTYHLSFTVTSTQGEILVWSYKQHRLIISHTSQNTIADCQLILNH